MNIGNDARLDDIRVSALPKRSRRKTPKRLFGLFLFFSWKVHCRGLVKSQARPHSFFLKCPPRIVERCGWGFHPRDEPASCFPPAPRDIEAPRRHHHRDLRASGYQSVRWPASAIRSPPHFVGAILSDNPEKVLSAGPTRERKSTATRVR